MAALTAFALVVSGLAFGVQPTTQAQAPITAVSGPRVPMPDVLKNMPEDMKVNHARYDNLLTALYERWLAGEDITAQTTTSSRSGKTGPFSPLYGPDVRMSTAAFAGS